MARRPAPRGPPSLASRPPGQSCYFNSPRCVCISNTLFLANILLFSSNANGTGQYVNPTLKYLSLWKQGSPAPQEAAAPPSPGCDARHASPRRHLGLRGRARAARGGRGGAGSGGAWLTGGASGVVLRAENNLGGCGRGRWAGCGLSCGLRAGSDNNTTPGDLRLVGSRPAAACGSLHQAGLAHTLTPAAAVNSSP